MNTCQSCKNNFEGKYCNRCGEKLLEESDFSMLKIVGDLFQAITFANSKLLKSLWFLIATPGKLSSEFVQGRRVGYMRPIALFFIINIFYFIAGSLNDYTPDLNHQYFYTPYKGYVQPIIDGEQNKLDLDDHAFKALYDSKSQYYAKSLVVINVPIIAFLYFIILFKRRKYYTENLIYTFHLFAFLLLSLTLIPHITEFLFRLTGNTSSAEKLIQLILLITIIVYSYFSIKKFYNINWYTSILVALLTFPIIFIAMTCFKFVLLHITLYNL